MFEWFKRFRRVAKQLSVAPRTEEKVARNTKAINLAPYTPEPKAFLGQLAYLHLANFEILTASLKYSPNTAFKAELSEAAARSFDKYRQLSKKLTELGADPAEQMNPFKERIAVFHSNTTGLDWYEVIVKIYLTSGLLDDFYFRLASGLNDDLQAEVEKALRDKTFEKFAKRVLMEAISADPVLGSRLALWGRRLMGDVLLELRAAFDNRKLAHVPKTKVLTVEEEDAVNLAAYALLLLDRFVDCTKYGKSMKRCPWCEGFELYRAYHDVEWGVPVRDDRELFELLILEGAQAGLSWSTVLKKRESYRLAFDGFDPEIIASYDDKKVAELLNNPGIIRNKLKVAATITNAKSYLALKNDGKSFSDFVWQFVDHKPVQNKRLSMLDVPAKTPESDAMSQALLKAGFKFVGSTICYAFMQASGMVNDHLLECHRYSKVKKI